MTCIVGLVEDGIVWMGCDSFVGNSSERYTSREPKIIKRGVKKGTPILLGFAGEPRGFTLMNKMKLPEYVKDPKDYVAMKLVDQMREDFKEAGYLEKDKDFESQNRLVTMVGLEGRLFTIGYNFNVHEFKEPYLAMGSAQEVAIGALYVLANKDITPRQKLIQALKAAECHTPFVKPPYVIISTK